MGVRKEIGEFRTEFGSRLVTLVIGALSFVAALSWNTAIQSLISEFIPASEEVLYQLGAAIGVTIIAVTGIVIISHIGKKK